MRMNVTAPAKTNARPYLDHLADRMAEVLPAIIAYRETSDGESRLHLESRIGELQHACELARRAL
jgi:hypothetical protein